MTGEVNGKDLAERVRLIECMITEGRHSTQRWAWTFLLWGVAYYVAIAWSAWGKSALAWPVTMIAAAIVMGVAASRIKRGPAGSVGGRTLAAVWSVMGAVLFALLMALSLSGRADLHIAVAIVGAMLAMANGISGIVLRWKMQVACALVWLGVAVGACFSTDMQTGVLAIAAIFFCQIVFGIYGMVLEGRERAGSAVHA